MSLERLFTTGSLRAEDMILPKTAEPLEGGREEPLIVPSDWTLEAADSFREALFLHVPETVAPVEENTVPSWLWRRRKTGNGAARAEKNAMDVFSRIAGSAAYRGWKAGLWQDETEASVFFDEAKAVLLTRRLVFSPQSMAAMGLDWAYGVEQAPTCKKSACPPDTLVLQNESIDAILSRSEPSARQKWLGFCETSRSVARATIAFADTLTEWNTLPCPACAPKAQINLMSFRQEDGSFDVPGLQQTTRIAILLMEMHEDVWNWKNEPTRPLALGFANLASLLMSLGLPYDSDKARVTASALAAIISGTALVESALLSRKRGPCAAFAQQREAVLRGLRNRLRASFGEENDYEKLSVRPQTISLASGADLVLLSAARSVSEQAFAKVQKFGLRHLQTTSLFTDSSFAALLDASAQGAEAESALVRDYAQEGGSFRRRLNPAVRLGMEKTGHDKADCEAIKEHLVGARTLVGAPGVNKTCLREKGFDDLALERIELSLQRISHLRQAFTPWALGLDFCGKVLKIPASELKNLRFDVLRHLGFSAREINAASAFCCGHRSTRGALDLSEAEHDVFVTRDDLSPEAQIKMSAAIQPFIDGETNLTISIPSTVVAQVRGELVLMAWKMGLKNIALNLDGEPLVQKAQHPVFQLIKRTTASSRTRTPVQIASKKKVSVPGAAARSAKTRSAIGLKSRAKPVAK